MKQSCIALAIVAVLAGCKSESKLPDPAPQSSIVQQVQAAGVNPGDLSQADPMGLQLWLAQHRDVAKNIAGPCKAAWKSDSTWQNSEEGRICLAVKNEGLLK